MAHENDTNNKRYYWLKLYRRFFNNVRIKKLRKLQDGDTCVIVLLKLLLLSLEQQGVLINEGVEFESANKLKNFSKEMSIKIDEDENIVFSTIQYLVEQGMLLEIVDNSSQTDNTSISNVENSSQNDDRNISNYFFPDIAGLIGTETQSNIYKRSKRLHQTGKKIPLDGDLSLWTNCGNVDNSSSNVDNLSQENNTSISNVDKNGKIPPRYKSKDIMYVLEDIYSDKEDDIKNNAHACACVGVSETQSKEELFQVANFVKKTLEADYWKKVIENHFPERKELFLNYINVILQPIRESDYQKVFCLDSNDFCQIFNNLYKQSLEKPIKNISAYVWTAIRTKYREKKGLPTNK